MSQLEKKKKKIDLGYILLFPFYDSIANLSALELYYVMYTL